MAKRHLDEVRPTGSVRLCVELCRRLDGRCAQWALVASLPGREGAAIYRWDNHSGRLNTSQVADICGRLEKLVTAAITIHDGMQEELPLA